MGQHGGFDPLCSRTIQISGRIVGHPDITPILGFLPGWGVTRPEFAPTCVSSFGTAHTQCTYP